MGDFGNLGNLSLWHWIIVLGYILLLRCFGAVKHMPVSARRRGIREKKQER